MSELLEILENPSRKALLDFVVQDPFLLEMFPCAAYLLKDDPDLTVIGGNALFFELFGCTEEHMRHRYANRLSALLSTESLRELETLESGDLDTPVVLRQQIKREGAQAWIYTMAVRVQCESAGAFCCVSVDITENERALRSLRQYAEGIGLLMKQVSFDAFAYDPLSETARLYTARNFLRPALLGELPEGADFARDRKSVV